RDRAGCGRPVARTRPSLVYRAVHARAGTGGDVAATSRRPLKQGYFTVPDDPAEPPRLLGTRCDACGEHFFPRRAVCAKCMSENTSEVLLGPNGTLYSYTFVHFPLFGSTKMEHVGYGVGQVDLPEGPRVQVPLAGK